MAELEDCFNESILRFFENEEEQRPVEEEERAEEEEKTVKEEGRQKKERPSEEQAIDRRYTPAVEVDAAIIEELLSKEATASELERL